VSEREKPIVLGTEGLEIDYVENFYGEGFQVRALGYVMGNC
jgi:Fe-S cluster assembly iron-binding protein IscA